MICEGCNKEVQKTTYTVESGKHLCRKCKEPIRPSEIHMDFGKYVELEAAEIVKDRIGKGLDFTPDIGRRELKRHHRIPRHLL